MSKRRPLPLESECGQKFWFNVRKTNECWIWLRLVNRDGYGVFPFRESSQHLAHRMAYAWRFGTVDLDNESLELDHLCRNRLCVRPDHLELVTHAENMHRAIRLECINGHPMEGDNVRISVRGSQICRTCTRIQTARFKAKKRIA